MKTRLLIISLIVITAVMITVITASVQSKDTPKYSKENPYGFSAKVVYSKEFLPLMCPVPNSCQTHLQLKILSDIPAILQGYKICNEFSCIEQDDVEYNTQNTPLIPIFDQNHWNLGDNVSIKVKAITRYDDETHPEPQTFYIDLGESKIVSDNEIDNTEIKTMIDLFQHRYHTSKITNSGSKIILNATNVWGETISLVIESKEDKVNSTLTCNHKDFRNQEIITENVIKHLENKNCFNPEIEETVQNNNLEPPKNYDSSKHNTVFDEGSPLEETGTGNPVLTEDNCERYAYWLTKYQKEKIDKYEDYPKYPPWGNQIFPLVNYCLDVGDLIKTVNDKDTQWSFQLNEN